MVQTKDLKFSKKLSEPLDIAIFIAYISRDYDGHPSGNYEL